MIIIDYEGYEDLRRIIISCCGLSFSGQGRTTQHVSLFIFSFVPNCSPKWATLQGNDYLVRWTCATIRSGYILVSIRLLIYPTKYLASNFCRTLLHKFWLLATAHYGFGKKWWFWVGRVRRCSKVSESWYRGLLVTCGHCPVPAVACQDSPPADGIGTSPSEVRSTDLARLAAPISRAYIALPQREGKHAGVFPHFPEFSRNLPAETEVLSDRFRKSVPFNQLVKVHSPWKTCEPKLISAIGAVFHGVPAMW